MKSNIKLPLDKMRPVTLLALMRNVVAKMTGNTTFPTPAIPLATLTSKADELEAAIELATNGSRLARLQRDKVAETCGNLLRQQADYVRSMCLGDATQLESSGYPLVKKREPIGIPGTPQKVEARITGLSGQLDLRWRSVHGAHGYQVWMTEKEPNVATNWQAIGFTTRVSHLITDLEAYKAYFFCVSAIGVAGEGAQSDPAMGRAA